MKKIFSIIAAFALLTGCDDGDMTYKTFDFTGKTVQSCPTTVDATTLKRYLINENEALILQIAPTALRNRATLDVDGNNIPYTIEISASTTATNSITYKSYTSKTIATQSVCSIGEDAAETEIWRGEGVLSVLTVEIREDDDPNKRLIGYTHKITMQNISFYNGDQTIIINDNVFGNIDKPFDFDFDFDITPNGDPDVIKCDENNLLYTVKNDELLSLSLLDYNAAFNSSNESIELNLGNDNNLNFKVFNGTLSSPVICTPAGGGGSITPAQTQFWKATAGKLRINTVMESGIVKYDIYAIDAIFTNTITGESFALKDIGERSTTIPNAYYFGRRK